MKGEAALSAINDLEFFSHIIVHFSQFHASVVLSDDQLPN